MRTIVLLLTCALAVGAAAQTEKKSDAKKAHKMVAAADSNLQADLVAKEKALYDAWAKKDGKPFEEWLSPNFVGVGDDGSNISREGIIKSVTTHNCEVKSLNISDDKVTPIDKDVVILTYKVDGDAICDGKKSPPIYASSIWKKQGSKWWTIFHQSTPAAPPKQQ